MRCADSLLSLCCLPGLSRLYDTYSFQVIPVVGELVAGDWKSYQYLVESIRKFPAQVMKENKIKNPLIPNFTSLSLPSSLRSPLNWRHKPLLPC